MKRYLLLAVLLPAFFCNASAHAGKTTTPLFALQDSDYHDNGAPDPAKVSLGAQLFFDKVLSGNLNISCASCHCR